MKNRKGNRLKGYNYSRDNLYFVTICVQDKLCCFGKIVEGTGRDLSVHDADISNPRFIPDESRSGQSNRIMVLNVYGSIVQNRLFWLEKQYQYCVLHSYVVMPNHVHAIVEIDSAKVKDVSIKIKSLSSLLGAFKTTSSKIIHRAGFLSFSWQRSFHDHIIKSERAYHNISNYIDANPQKWNQDTFHIHI